MIGPSRLLLTSANHPAAFWRLVDRNPSPDAWEDGAREALGELGTLPAALRYRGLEELLEDVLVEGQFGADHWMLSPMRRLYYGGLRRFMPSRLRPLMRRRFLAPQRREFALDWPVEDRFSRFMRRSLENALRIDGGMEGRRLAFWPDGARFAVALTHDVESFRGVEFLPDLLDLEERYGFRSLVNLVPREYPIPDGLIGELRERGFEVGVHGLDHSGDLFLNPVRFARRAVEINDRLMQWGAVGFRAPFTHRNPQWMQALDVEYDSSFFDTDPFESIPGGTMSIWPFFMGRFVELPYTLVQDHTLVETLAETTPTIWLDKVDAISHHGGMALLTSHPDYLREGLGMSIYEEFLAAMARRADSWKALPRDVARWWRRRAHATPQEMGDMAVEKVRNEG